MILKHLDALTQKRIVLASQSPRREQLIGLMGLKVRKQPSTFEENLQPKEFASPGDYAVATAREKAIEVAASLGDVYDLIIAADTIVELDGEVLEKPRDPSDAVETLMRLSGRQHCVFTGVVLAMPAPSAAAPELETFYEATHVWFDAFDQEEAQAYVKTGEPMDKAGSYGIQGYGASFVKRIEGCYFNVMGLPVQALASRLKALIEEQRF